jgi:hypothetical protein
MFFLVTIPFSLGFRRRDFENFVNLVDICRDWQIHFLPIPTHLITQMSITNDQNKKSRISYISS